MKPRVAIVCDWLVSRGGAERVIWEIAKMFPDAPIYTSIYNEESLPEFKERKIVTSYINKIPFAHKAHHLFLPFMPSAFEQFDLSEFDIVISSCHSCSKGIITKPKTLHISYCHSPMRYLWDSCHTYFEQFGIPKVVAPFAKRILHTMRIWDRAAADRVDHYIANSEHVEKRIEKYYRRTSEVIYPPVDTDKFKLKKKGSGSQYFLAVGRLTTYKRFDLVVEAFNELSLPLIIVGKGKDERSLSRKAGRFITFLGQISDEQLAEVYKGATALVFPQVEDFGITPLEAMASGTPVIAYGEGGALETVVEGKTGLFFKEQSADALKKAVLEFQKMSWDPEIIRKHALTFRSEEFREKMREYIDSQWKIWIS